MAGEFANANGIGEIVFPADWKKHGVALERGNRAQNPRISSIFALRCCTLFLLRLIPIGLNRSCGEA
jgi:hypothetical protein